ncbi:MAG: CoA transferase, partial [Halioglobus sp.]|nr:CoA transferase [Halioglobus sp.]
MDRWAMDYAGRLLDDLGSSLPRSKDSGPLPGTDPWQKSGLAELTGSADQALLDSPLPIASLADGALAALRMLSGADILPDYHGSQLLTLRAAMTGLRRNGAIAPGGSCRILPCADGHVAVNLTRDSDWQSLDAWLQTPSNPDWDSVKHRVRGCDRSTL